MACDSRPKLLSAIFWQTVSQFNSVIFVNLFLGFGTSEWKVRDLIYEDRALEETLHMQKM